MTRNTASNHKQFLNHCNAEARKILLKRRIIDVRYMTSEECEHLQWEFTSIVLVLDDGTLMYAARDAEGNEAGTFCGVTREGEDFVLPAIPCN